MTVDERARATPTPATTTAGGAPRWLRPLPLVVLLGGWLALVGQTDAYLNPDGTAYVAVAERVLAGDLAGAVNGYWSPLLPWATTPLMALGVDGLLALRLVLLVSAAAVLVLLRRLALRAGAAEVAADVVLVAVAPFLVYATLFGLYPDVLTAAAVLLAADLLLRPGASAATTLAGGAVAGVAYLSKAFALPAVLVLVPVWVVLRRWGASTGLSRPRSADGRGGRPTWGATGRGVVVAMLGLALVAGPWVGVLSATYGAPTFSTSAGFNATLVAPGSAGNPFNVPGLHEPPRPDALSAWEEPSALDVPLAPQAREETGEEFVDPDRGLDLPAAAGNVVAQTLVLGGVVARRALPLVALAVVGVVVLARRRQAPSPVVTGTLAASAVWVGGLVLSIAIERYSWVPVLLLVPAAAVGASALAGRRRAGVLVLAAVLVPAMTLASLRGLAPRLGAGEDVERAAQRLSASGGLDGRVAGTTAWADTLALCYRLGCTYVGRPDGDDLDEVAAELAAADVEHLLVWGGDVLPTDAGVVREDFWPPELAPASRATLLVYDVTADGLVLDRVVGTEP
ncbi:hypothetical protein [Pseudokineococcus sp. 1T1Z-3]|uniref:hypothetical protein n=1 Tax=Pseudokineococcus sp. 1T1Z-3 TaxID=3132745 RepID=UPI0030A7B749